MTQSYFSIEHFNLLKEWRGTVYDKTNPEQKLVYDELVQAYDITKRWAKAVQEQLFKDGWTKAVRKPIDQWQKKFTHYNWARIYPRQNATEGLAYTVGIDAELGFEVKIDLVDNKISDPAVKKRYEKIRGSLATSPIVAIKPSAEGLAMGFTELVAWSADAIKNFKLSYDEVADQLGLYATNDPQTLLRHFQGHKDFRQRQPLWGSTTTELFIRLARAVNSLGLDWWFTLSTNSQLCFGRKETGDSKGWPVGRLFLRKDGIRFTWDTFAGMEKGESSDLTEELVRRFESADKDEGSWPAKLGLRAGRNGYWPDAYSSEDKRIEDESVSGLESKPDHNASRLPKNIIYYGPPGTGKTLVLQKLLKKYYTDSKYGERYEFVTFHQSYGYEEFVEGLRPVITQQNQQQVVERETTIGTNDGVRYEIRPGAFLRLCDRARDNPSQQYAMVIDEINRGNISKIFGELITLVEADKREGATYPVSVTLPYSGERFSVPLNVDVIGTMNTSDRSLALLDTALRRRFDFRKLIPRSSALAGIIVSHNGVDINLEQMLTTLNKRIEALYDRDHSIGHAYFTDIKHLPPENRFTALKAVFRNRIIPLLEEYFFEDWQKIRLVLGDNQELKSELQFVHEIDSGKDLKELFGSKHELDQYAPRSRYQLNIMAFNYPDAYVGIYDSRQP